MNKVLWDTQYIKYQQCDIGVYTQDILNIFAGIVPFILLLGLNITVYIKILELQRATTVIQGGTSANNNQKFQEIRLSQISIAIVTGKNVCL